MGIKLKDILTEKYEIDLEVGDTILRGKFKNKPVVVKSFGTDDKGQPTVNGKKMLSFRIKKLMPKKEVNEELRPEELKKLATDLAYSMPSHTKYDDKKGPTDSQIIKAMKKYYKDLFQYSSNPQKKQAIKIVKKVLSEGKLNEDSPYAVFKKIEKLKGGALLKFGNEIWVKIGNKKDQWLCKKGPEKGVISDSTVVAQRIFKVLGKKHKLLKIEGEVNEGRPMPTDSPNEFAYLDFKKWAYKKRGKIKKQMNSLSPENVNRALVAVWEMWDKMKNKGAYSRIKNIKKFGKILYKMMKKDRLVEKYNIRKSSCKQSDGDSGSYRLSYTTKKGKKRSACHTSKKKAQDQIKAIEAPPR